MRTIKRTVLFTLGAALLAGPAFAQDGDKPQEKERERKEVTAEQRQQAMEERRKAVHSLPAEQRAAVREAHQKAMQKERETNRVRNEEQGQMSRRGAMGAGGMGMGKRGGRGMGR